MNVAIIVNPGSGRQQRGSESRVDVARRLVSRSGVSVDLAVTNAAGHARELAAEFVARQYERVVAWGGDGTVNEVAGPLIGSQTIFGVVPAGSGDGFAHSVGLPRQTPDALKAALTAPARAVDVGMFGDRHFLNVAGIGFDAAVAGRFNARAARGGGGYAVESLTGVWTYTCEVYEVTAGGEQFSGPLFLVAFANGREYGNGLILAPQASAMDGQLDMVVVTGGGPLKQCWRARRLLVRRMAPAEGVWRSRVTSATITGDRLVAHVDGETFQTSGTVAVSLLPGALMVAGAEG
jgi:YegS/Rv2252/BmrU family lipid kinase